MSPPLQGPNGTDLVLLMIDPAQADSGIEVHKQFAFYLPGSKMTSQMTWIQRGVGVLQALREYAPITNVVALILLPVAVIPTRSDEFALIAAEHDRFWLRSLFVAAFLAHKLNDYIVYGHVGLPRLASFQSMDIWCAPCKYDPVVVRIHSHDPIPHSHDGGDISLAYPLA